MTRLLLIGHFGNSDDPVAGRPLKRIDLDSFDAALEAFAPTLTVGDETITFSRLEDFHPDELFRKLARFAGLREVRRRLLDPLTFAATAAALEGTGPNDEDDARTVERILGVRPPSRSGDFIERIVAPYVVPDIGPRQKRLVGAIDQAASQHMNALLHHPPLQRLEAAWRAVHRLVTTVEPDDLAIYLLDASAQELRADIASRLADGAPDGRPWSLLAVDETFGAGEHDVAVLGALGALAASAGAPLVAAAHPLLAGFSSFAPLEPAALPPDDAARWQALRESTNARWLGLAAPRWLVRLPYGARTDPIDELPFEEVVAHESYLWGSPAFACAILLAAGNDELTDLPCHTFRRDGEAHLQPVAEALFPDRAAAAMLEGGLIPLLSVRDRGAATVARMQSLAGLPLGR